MVLDTGATIHAFGNDDLLVDIYNSDRKVTIGGFSTTQDLVLWQKGTLREFGQVWVHQNLKVNVLSVSQLRDDGAIIAYRSGRSDEFIVRPKNGTNFYIFRRKSGSNLYTCRFEKAIRWGLYYMNPIAGEEHHFQYFTGHQIYSTVTENMTHFTANECKRAAEARLFMGRIGSSNSLSAKRMIRNIFKCAVTDRDIDIADMIYGPKAVSALMGESNKRKAPAADIILRPKVHQQQQHIYIDLMFIQPLVFIVMVCKPLDMTFCQLLDNGTTNNEISSTRRNTAKLEKAINAILATINSRGFEVVSMSCDGEGGITALIPSLNIRGITVSIAAAGGHIPQVERKIQFIKNKHRAIVCSLPFIMPKLIKTYCVYFNVGCINHHVSSTAMDAKSPRERFTGEHLHARDFRFEFGQYAHATVATTSNDMSPRTSTCICLLSSYNNTGSIRLFDLNTKGIITRDSFQLLPMPESVIQYLNAISRSEGNKGSVRFAGGTEIAIDIEGSRNLPDMIVPADLMIDDLPFVDNNAAPIDHAAIEANIGGGAEMGAGNGAQDNTGLADDLVAPVGEIQEPSGAEIQEPAGAEIQEPVDPPPRLGTNIMDRYNVIDRFRGVVHPQLHMSIKAAMREYPLEAKSAIHTELKQMLDKRVWTPVLARSLKYDQRKAIIRSSMFLKEKISPTGQFEKIKARLVAGGDQQDKSLYTNLSAATAATSSVFMIAAIAAREKRAVAVVDITGAYLNASMTSGVIVHMRIDKPLTEIITKMDSAYIPYVRQDGGCIVRLDKALYGCVESAALWGEHIKGTLLSDGFTQNPHEVCCYNKLHNDGQTSVVIHVDDLLITSRKMRYIDDLITVLKRTYKDIRTATGDILGYLGLSMDFSTPGEVKITAPAFTKDLLASCRAPSVATSPATEQLFEVREDPELTVPESDKIYFHSYVAKLLYLGKRVRPEILTAVALLTTRVTKCNRDDMNKLHRVLSYINGSPERGIILRIGDGPMSVRAYIDAAYGVHADSKSHTGCSVIVGESGASYNRSAKQKIVTKSSTESELVALSDSANVPIHMASFLRAQGHEIPPVILYQDNKSAMALINKGRSTSDLSKHISLRYFWLSEKIEEVIVKVEYCSTNDMCSNVLTKPVQGKQFKSERKCITGYY